MSANFHEVVDNCTIIRSYRTGHQCCRSRGNRVTEENKVLKSRYENAIEVNVYYIEIIISNLPYVSCVCTLS